MSILSFSITAAFCIAAFTVVLIISQNAIKCSMGVKGIASWAISTAVSMLAVLSMLPVAKDVVDANPEIESVLLLCASFAWTILVMVLISLLLFLLTKWPKYAKKREKCKKSKAIKDSRKDM